MASEPFEIDDSLIAEKIISRNLNKNMELMTDDLGVLASEYQDMFNEF